MSENARKLGTAMLWSVSSRAVRFMIGIASSIIVVRSLGDHDYGAFSVVRSMMMFVVLLCATAPSQLLLKFIPTLRVKGARGEARRLFARVAGFVVTAWLVAVALSYAAAGLVDRVFNVDGLGVVFAAAAALVLFDLFFHVLVQLLNSNYDTGLMGIASIVTQAVYVVLLVLFLGRGWGIIGVFAAMAVGNLVACIIVLGRARVALSFAEAEGSEPLASARLLKYALPFAAIGVLNVVVWRQSETLLLAHFRGAVETGQFDLAYRLPQMVLEFIPATVWPLIMAAISESHERDPGRLGEGLARYYRMLFVLCAPICATGAVLAGKMITIFYGQQMAAAAIPAQVFFGIFTLSFFGTPLSMGLYVMEKTHINLVIYLVLAVINVGLDLLLIPRFGLAGAMVPVAIVMFISPFIYRVVLGRMVEDLAIPWKFIARCFLASAPVALIVPLLRYVDNVGTLLAAVVVAIGILIVSFKKARVLGGDEFNVLGSIPVPMADRFLRFMSS